MCGFFITEIFPRMGRLLLIDTSEEIFLEQRFYLATVCRDFKLLLKVRILMVFVPGIVLCQTF